VQAAPRVRLTGQVWDTDDAVSRTVTADTTVEPISGTNPFAAYSVKVIDPDGHTVRLVYLQSFGVFGAGALFYNTAVGGDALLSLTSGFYNSAYGLHAMHETTTGYRNNAIGVNALYANTVGQFNQVIGVDAMRFNTSGSHNVVLGEEAMFTNDSGSDNIAIGSRALHQNVNGGTNTAVGRDALFNTTGSGNTALGMSAGAFETGSNAFYVDNQNRGNTAGDKAGALLYGTFNATPANQTLTVNAVLTVRGTADVTGLKASGVSGASCTLTTVAHLTVVNGIVTLCN
jgi:hypothetical protein